MSEKKDWPPGPWDQEDDRFEWRHEGFACLIVRNRMGALCGYVATPPGHIWHGVKYDKIDVDVHGSLTYSNKCSGHICHVPQLGESDDVWWLGFDCGHAGDLIPAMYAHRKNLPGFRDIEMYESYRDVEYVKREVNALAEQAKEAS